MDQSGERDPNIEHGRHTVLGTLKGFGAETVGLPAGLLITVFLTRQLGPEDYGLFAVAASIAFSVQVSASLVLGRTTVRFVAEATEWRAVASALVRAQLVLSAGAAVLLAVTAPLIGSWLRSPDLTPYLRLFALDVPIFGLAYVHRAILTGRGAFGQQALATASRWLARLVLVVALVGAGLSVTGAILASIGASTVSLLMARRSVRPPLFARSSVPVRQLQSYALPLFLSGVSLHLVHRLDLWVVKALSPAPETAGFYAAAQNLTIVPGMFAAAFAPLLLATLTRAWRDGHDRTAQTIAEQALRFVWLLLPCAAAVAGTARELVALAYGSPFAPAAPLVTLLSLGTVGMTMLSVIAAILTAAGRPRAVLALTGPLIPVAVAAHLILVPRLGPGGAAAVTASLAWIGAGAGLLAVARAYGIAVAGPTLARTGSTALTAYGVARMWPTTGGWVILELGTLGAIILGCLWASGELTREDRAFIRALLRIRG